MGFDKVLTFPQESVEPFGAVIAGVQREARVLHHVQLEAMLGLEPQPTISAYVRPVAFVLKFDVSFDIPAGDTFEGSATDVTNIILRFLRLAVWTFWARPDCLHKLLTLARFLPAWYLTRVACFPS
jgi:hypothetical protein